MVNISSNHASWALDDQARKSTPSVAAPVSALLILAAAKDLDGGLRAELKVPPVR